jgi:hypothetical protein
MAITAVAAEEMAKAGDRGKVVQCASGKTEQGNLRKRSKVGLTAKRLKMDCEVRLEAEPQVEKVKLRLQKWADD